MENGDGASGMPREYAPRSYALRGKIMLTAVIILFTVVILVVGLHLYARWYLLRARRRQYLRRRAHRTHFVFSGDGQTTSATTTVISPSLGLDASVLKSLPIFVYSPNSHKEVLECAVCLSEFEENEKGRVLPKCKHCFHIDCIDMWLHSHSTCPLCRSPVKPEILPETIISSDSPVSIDIPVGEFEESEVGSSSGFCSSLINEDEMGSSSSSSSTSRKKPLHVMGVSIGIPKRSESFRSLEEESGSGSPSCQGFKSPVNRIRSLKRLLSRERKTVFSSSPSSPIPLRCSSNTETDLERGDEQIIQPPQQ